MNDPMSHTRSQSDPQSTPRFLSPDVTGLSPAARDSSRWTLFTWKSVHPDFPSVDLAAEIRPVRDEEKEEALDVILRSFSMDSSWNDSYLRMEHYLKTTVERLFRTSEPLCLVLPKGNRLVAVSLMDPDPVASNHLVSGPAVTMEYRNRGIATLLLSASLRALENAGLAEIRGITRERTTSVKHLYPKFGSEAAPAAFPETHS
jgi:ribosomal protein S18 acetylase RimI-like enzyme